MRTSNKPSTSSTVRLRRQLLCEMQQAIGHLAAAAKLLQVVGDHLRHQGDVEAAADAMAYIRLARRSLTDVWLGEWEKRPLKGAANIPTGDTLARRGPPRRDSP